MKLKLIAVTVLTLFSSMTLAGLVQPVPVEVDLDINSAFGNMVTARFSTNDVELIGCGVRYIDDGAGGVFTFGFCQATDADGETLFCATTDNPLIEAIQSISAFSFISFAADEAGDCTRIGNSSQSFYIPKGVKGK